MHQKVAAKPVIPGGSSRRAGHNSTGAETDSMVPSVIDPGLQVAMLKRDTKSSDVDGATELANTDASHRQKAAEHAAKEDAIGAVRKLQRRFSKSTHEPASAQQIAQQDLQQKMQQWHSTTALGSQRDSSNSSCSGESQQSPASGLVGGPEYDELVRDVAARIIQTYWKRYCAHFQASKRTGSSDRALEARTHPLSRSSQRSGATCHTAEESSNWVGSALDARKVEDVITEDLSGIPSRRCSSNGGNTENMESLMNRYRGDTASQRSSKNEQEVMEHAIGILRAAGVNVGEGSNQQHDSGTGQRMLPRSISEQDDMGSNVLQRSQQHSRTCSSPEQSRPMIGRDNLVPQPQSTKADSYHGSVMAHNPEQSNSSNCDRYQKHTSPALSTKQQVENLLQYTEQDGCEVAIEWSPNARLRNPGPHTSKTDSLEEGRKVSDIMDFLDAISQQADQEAAQVADTCCSNGASVCGSQPNDMRDVVLSSRRDSLRSSRLTESESRPEVTKEQGLSARSSSGGKASNGASFCEEVRNRTRRMQLEMKKREDSIASLHVQIQSLTDKHSNAILHLEQQHSDALASQKSESDAALQRHLDLIDRLLSDKDVLTRQIDSMQEQHTLNNAKHEDTMKAMKSGWAQELKQQKEAWTAAEKAKRENWLAEKTKEIKDITIKGLEPEIQTLVQKHRQEVAELKEAHMLDTKRQVDAISEQHNVYVRQLRERLLHDRESAIEGERAAAQKRLSEAAERYEASAAQARMNLVAEHDRRLTESEDSWRTQRRDLMDTLKKAEQALEEARAGQVSAVAQAREEERQAHRTAVQHMKEDYDAENTAWRQAIAEKARKQLAESEKQLKSTYQVERDQQIDMVLSRLDKDNIQATTELKNQHASEIKALKDEHASALAQARGSQQRYAERHRDASAALNAAEERSEASQELVKHLKGLVDDKESRISDLERQLRSASSEMSGALTEQRQELQRQAADKEKSLEETRAEVKQLQSQLTQAHAEMRAHQQRKVDEMDRVENRVKAAIQRKDETIAALRGQLQELQQHMRSAEDMLTVDQ